jgi:hypothetical protein
MTWIHDFLTVSETDMDDAVDLNDEGFLLWAEQLKKDWV